MELKKNHKANLEKKRMLFIQAGLIIGLVLMWIALEWKTYETSAFDLGKLKVDNTEEEIIPITEREVKPPPPPPLEVLNIVQNEEEIKEELDVKNEEVTEETKIAPIQQEEVIEEAQIFTIVEEMPKFGNGDEDLINYLVRSTKYPQMARESGISGIVYVTFVVNPKGEIQNVKVLRGIGGGCDEEAVRVVSGMPNWKPGKQRGKPVPVQYNLPYRFVLH